MRSDDDPAFNGARLLENRGELVKLTTSHRQQARSDKYGIRTGGTYIETIHYHLDSVCLWIPCLDLPDSFKPADCQISLISVFYLREDWQIVFHISKIQTKENTDVSFGMQLEKPHELGVCR